jgi:hypothetical protein
MEFSWSVSQFVCWLVWLVRGLVEVFMLDTEILVM